MVTSDKGHRVENYTEGEWKVEDRESGCTEYLGIENLSKDTFPLIINMPTPFSVLGRCGAIVSAGCIFYTEAQANAHLIAAAPEMYEACKGIIAKRMECHETEAAYIPPEVEAVYKAIAKAEGG